MKRAARLPVPRLKITIRPIAVALLLLLPAAAMANRPRIRPHHQVPAKWRKAIAGRITTVTIPMGSSSNYSVSGGATFSLSGASMSSATFYNNAATFATAGLVSGAGTLTIAAPFVNQGNITAITAATQFSPSLASTAAFVKTGVGTLSLAAPFAYQGNIAVNAGTLSLSTAVLADTGTLSLATGVLLNLNFAGSDTIGLLRIDGVTQNSGTWGSLTSDATYKTALITGTGILNVVGEGGASVVNPPVLETGGATLTLVGGSHLTTNSAQLATGANPIVANAGTLELTHGTATLIATPIVAGTADLSGAVLVVNGGTLSAAALSRPVDGAPAAGASDLSGAPPIPEPSSVLLTLLGAGLLSQRRRRG